MRRSLIVLALVLGACGRSEPPFDYAAACGAAEAPALTPGDLRRISETIKGASSGGGYQPKGKNVERWTAAVLLQAAADEAAAPYRLPSQFQQNLPPRPDNSEVLVLQRRLLAACRT